ncbi:hypothetical protein F7725_025466 [Dissostichus mawsoni]|uniref:C-mannosyltransferase DPY19L4 n=1 Tax=Dissostichus mawsoni TaxID=36200 RepID=A0A7J5XB78_DISMA|nr:hypothetical protein F7725_025466 [Dissostichus mawsoni]
MTELKCRKKYTLDGDKEEEESQHEPEVQTATKTVSFLCKNIRVTYIYICTQLVVKEPNCCNLTCIKEPVKTEEDEVSNGRNGAGKQQKDEDEVKEEDAQHKEVESKTPESPVKRSTRSSAGFLQRLVRVFFGCLAAVACGMLYAAYLSAYHDRKFWFSTRQELEREITFQGGSGLYYYYYKQMLTATPFDRGFYELMMDNRTVAGQTINAVVRLSLYPELITSFIYRFTGSEEFVEPIYFYIGAVFGLQAIYVSALFVCSWVMSGTWVAGMLAVAWYVINRPDTTKVDYAIPLRDNWALPYFSCQVAALTGFLTNNISSATELFCYLTMSATTFTFLLVWEHSHYVLFLQGLCLFFLDAFDLLPSRKMAEIHMVYVSALLLAFFSQFQNAALLSSPLVSLLIGTWVARNYQQKMKTGPFLSRVMKLFVYFHLVFTTGITFSYLVKKVVQGDESDFFLKFLEVKFGLNTTTDFITNFLLCQKSFQVPGQDLFLRLTQASVLPFYLLVLTVCLLSTLQTIYRRLSGQPMKTNLKLEDGRIGEQPEVIYHVFHTLIFGGLALLFDGMKYLWTPYVCMFTAFGVCSPELWMTVFRWLKLKSIHPVVLLSEVQEFYDPDKVELISWIKSQAPAAAAFAGSPQLLGTVKLCSGATVTSLPLYTDIKLLRRTEDKANYVIIEESICNELSVNKGCRIKDLLDISNGHVVYDKGEVYSFSKHGRFCQEIKMNYSPYTNYFTRVFWNRSYHVYKVNSVISFQY